MRDDGAVFAFGATEAFSFEAYVNGGDQAGANAVFGALDRETTIGWRLLYYPPGLFACQLLGPSGRYPEVAADDVPSGWHHVHCVREDGGAVLRIYIDGALVASSTLEPVDVTNPAPLVIGNTEFGVLGDSQWFVGDIDEVRVTSP